MRLKASSVFFKLFFNSKAIYEVNQNDGGTQCCTGLNKMTETPSDNCCPHCFDKCFAKEISIAPVQIREEKFISSNDVVSTIITTDRYASTY